MSLLLSPPADLFKGPLVRKSSQNTEERRRHRSEMFQSREERCRQTSESVRRWRIGAEPHIGGDRQTVESFFFDVLDVRKSTIRAEIGLLVLSPSFFVDVRLIVAVDGTDDCRGICQGVRIYP